MTDFASELARRVLVCDGATGTMLHAAGNSLDRALPELNLANPDLVATIHDSYLSAGVDIIQTNTFGASRLRLDAYSSTAGVREVNAAGARIAREAARRSGRPVFVAGSISPAVTARQRPRASAAQRAQAVREQAEALVEGGVDLLMLETFGYLDELAEAVAVVAGLPGAPPVIAQATFTPDGATFGGETPREVATALSALPVAVIGVNCTLGPQHTLTILGELRRHTSLPVSAQPNAGLPRRVHGRRFEYHIDGDYFARYASRYVAAGASVVGGCCGTTPTHLRAAVEQIGAASPRRQRSGPVYAGSSVQPGGGDVAERLAAGAFAVMAELSSQPGSTGEEAVDAVAALRGRGAEVFLIGPPESARAQVGAVNLALHLRQRTGVETVATVTTWDKTIMTLQADLLGAHALGMRAIVCETGNPPLRGDYPNVDGIWEVDSVGLIALLAGLNEGRDSDGLPLATKTSFQIGARFNPGARDMPAELARARAKIAAGAQFLISRPVYELETFSRLRDELAPQEAPVLLCLSPLRSFDEADYLAHEVPDVTVPEATLRAMEAAGPDGAAAGLDLACALAARARDLADGVVLRCGDDADTLAALIRAL